MSEDAQLAQRQPTSVRDFLSLPAYKSRFAEVLGQRAPQFMASLIQITNDPNLGRCEPKSVIASAMIAAILDLPIEKSLGMAHLVPYGGICQFQMAAKGYIQLALRSGQYQRLNAKPVNAEAFGGYDDIGEPKIDWGELDETKPTVGYVVAWRLTNGFTKVAYWPKNKVENHAAQFSQAYKKKKMDSPWFTNFDKMALKTVVMNELRAWGVLSVQMQTALKHDMGAQKDVEAEVEYVDGTTEDATEANATVEAAPQRPPPPPRAKRGAAAVAENVVPSHGTIEVVVSPAVQPNPAPYVPGPAAEKTTAVPAPAPVPAAEQAALAAMKAAAAAEVDKALAHADAVAKTLPKAEPAPQETDVNALPPDVVAVINPAGKQRAFLEPKEAVIFECTVADVKTKTQNLKTEQNVPTVDALLKGAYTGPALHPKGATVVGSGTSSKLVPKPEWTVGNKVRVTLYGQPHPSGKVMVRVSKIEVIAPADDVAF